MVGHGYTSTDADHFVYFRLLPSGEFIILLLYVDDILIVEQDSKVISDLKRNLSES